ncbi:MAG: formate acetyltransferase [Deltaproteobacteria bacterium]|nr:formate acetyltransferase [Deltaproteobacteria bacterium]
MAVGSLIGSLVSKPIAPLRQAAAARSADVAANLLLRAMTAHFNWRPKLREYLLSRDGWLDLSVSVRTENGTVGQGIVFHEGRVRVVSGGLEDPDVALVFADEKEFFQALGEPPHDAMDRMLKNRVFVEGNLNKAQLFVYLASLLLARTHEKRLARAKQEDERARKQSYAAAAADPPKAPHRRRTPRVDGLPDPGVRFLDDVSLSRYTLEDFPRLEGFLEEHFSATPQICAERPLLLTRFFRENGFEKKLDGSPWHPVLRQAEAFHFLMANKKPLIAENSLLAGSTTARLPTGVVIYPDAQGGILWGELKTVGKRLLNPYILDEQTERDLHHEVFPFWMERNFWEWVRTEHHNPLCQKINNRWVAYFAWKTVGMSHCIPDFGSVLEKGTHGIMEEIAERREDPGLSRYQKDTLWAMRRALEGINIYADHLRKEAKRRAAAERDEARKKELSAMARALSRVPKKPAKTLYEAMSAVWVLWVGAHMENANTGLSLGRLDRLFQPYLESDMARLKFKEAREKYLKHALELTADFMMRCTDHLPLVPDIGNYLFGGSSSDQAITLGGVTPRGEDAVCDMTYVFLKATEMLGIRDPNVNARFHPEKNTDTYLSRLCAVNYATTATPSMHNDQAVMAALEKHGFQKEHLRDWVPTGCVEPSIPGRHMGHTGSILFNLVAPLEMALNNGTHPLMRWDLGPKTGSPEQGAFADFEDFFAAYAKQFRFLADQAVSLNHMLAEAHAKYRPTPYLSALMDGCVQKAEDVTAGGARYNSSGTANIGLADVTDSLMAIKKLVFEDKAVDFAGLKRALADDFSGHPGLQAMLKNKVPLFGSGDPEALAMANRVAALVHDTWAAHTNYRGGRYTTGFWSMSQHVAYGNLSGALPSGRNAGRAFTPGLSPQPHATPDFLKNIRDVARLDPANLDNSIAFNVKLSPAAGDPPEKTNAAMTAYVKAYFSMGGMQMQFNVVDSETLKAAMASPEDYKQLLVRISGYNAYFVTLNRQMQLELIERAQYGC